MSPKLTVSLFVFWLSCSLWACLPSKRSSGLVYNANTSGPKMDPSGTSYTKSEKKVQVSTDFETVDASAPWVASESETMCVEAIMSPTLQSVTCMMKTVTNQCWRDRPSADVDDAKIKQ
ncbi:unnamed protein product [Lymnaea stagnalis]|uniref:Uncharacterized protein n=1 Tax=Lymnaea stagnalis TaxID=6523 RepID=A0AAV2IEM4_LYMST